MSLPLKDTTLRYPPIYKKAYALIKYMNTFIYYIIKSPIIDIMSDVIVKNMLAQHKLGKK